jgi:hypothetical protein
MIESDACHEAGEELSDQRPAHRIAGLGADHLLAVAQDRELAAGLLENHP